MEYVKLDAGVRLQILEQKIVQYEASHYDATVELMVAVAAGDMESERTQRERCNMLAKGIEVLKAEILAAGLSEDNSANGSAPELAVQ